MPMALSQNARQHKAKDVMLWGTSSFPAKALKSSSTESGLSIHRRAIGQRARNNKGIVRNSRHLREHLRRLRRQGHGPRAGFTVPQMQLVGRRIHILPTHGQNLAAPAPRQHQQPDRRHRMHRDAAAGLRLTQYTAQAAELFFG